MTECEGDCDDADTDTHAGAIEICDGVDNDCDGNIPADETDDDGDGMAECDGDCDDTDTDTYAGATEICDGVDNDCDGNIPADEVDGDGDGYLICEGDCDDGNAAVYPGATEMCNGIDDDCNGSTDDNAADAVWYYPDGDGDGYGDEDAGVLDCTQPAGWITDGTDCDDGDADIHPGATEHCDGVDEDCDGSVDEGAMDVQMWYPDADGDSYGDESLFVVQCTPPSGWINTGGDCDDTDPAVNPAAVEYCDGIDNDCTGVIDDNALDASTWYADLDGDSYGDAGNPYTGCEQPVDHVNDSTDCDDSDDQVNPAATEICDGVDNDCDGLIDDADPDLGDGDGDGVAACSDCDDTDASIYTGAAGVIDVPGDSPTIQGGIDLAATGDVVCVENGTYPESVDFGGKGVLVTGSGAAVIDGSGTDRVVVFDSGEAADSELRGMTITNGYHSSRAGGIYVNGTSPTLTRISVTRNDTVLMGGGIFINGPSTAVLNDVRIRYNTSDNYSGGMHIAGGATPVINDVEIVGNEADYAGGLGIGGASPIISGGTVFRNTALGGAGGVYYMASAAGTLDGMTIAENEAVVYGADGGGMSLASSSTPTLSNLTITDNYAYGLGGGVYIYMASPVLTDSLIADNESFDDGGGIGFYLSSSAQLSGLEVTGNVSGDNGGGIFMEDVGSLDVLDSFISGNSAQNGGGIGVTGTCSPLLDNLTIADNTADTWGGGIWVFDDPSLDMTNVLITDNVAGDSGGGLLLRTNSSADLTQVIVVGNAVSGAGYGGGISVNNNSSITLTNVTVAGNHAEDGEGAGVSCSGTADLNNVVIAHNTLGIGGSYGGYYNASGTTTMTFSDIWGNDGIDAIPDLVGLYGNISEDPLFVDLSPMAAVDWDLHLGAASQCVDGGDLTLFDPDGSRSDIGAYGGPDAEYWDLDVDGYFEWWIPGAYDAATSPGMDCDDQDDAVYPGNGCGQINP